MDVELVSDTPPEVYDAHVIVPTFGDQLLYGYLFAGEKPAYSGSLRDIIHTNNMHFGLLERLKIVFIRLTDDTLLCKGETFLTSPFAKRAGGFWTRVIAYM
jgi:hypothetical protein